MNEENFISKITVEIAGDKTTWERPDADCHASELIEAFAGLLMTQGYTYNTVHKGMQMYLDGMSGMEEFMIPDNEEEKVKTDTVPDDLDWPMQGSGV